MLRFLWVQVYIHSGRLSFDHYLIPFVVSIVSPNLTLRHVGVIHQWLLCCNIFCANEWLYGFFCFIIFGGGQCSTKFSNVDPVRSSPTLMEFDFGLHREIGWIRILFLTPDVFVKSCCQPVFANHHMFEDAENLIIGSNCCVGSDDSLATQFNIANNLLRMKTRRCKWLCLLRIAQPVCSFSIDKTIWR